MRKLLKALQSGLPEALIIGFGVTLLYILVPLFANGGSLLIVEASQSILVVEIMVAVSILTYGIHRLRNLIRYR